MHCNLAKLIAAMKAAGCALQDEGRPTYARVGKILRQFSIDGLPQFINVTRQEMSVVGQRPPLRREAETYDVQVKRRLLVRPASLDSGK